MSNQPSIISTAMRSPLSIALIIFTIVIALIYIDYRSILTQQSVTASSTNTNTNTGLMPPLALKGPSLENSGRSLPKIMDTMGGGGDETTAPGLEGLIAGLESKVKGDPGNIGQRILLSQTYKELGMLNKSLEALRNLRKEFPDHLRAKLVMASVLSQQSEEKDLQEALALLTELSKSKDISIKQYMVLMYEGDANIRLKNHDVALKKWSQSLETMPKTDNRFVMLEKQITDLKARQGDSANKG